MTPRKLVEALADIGKGAAWLELSLRGLHARRYCFASTVTNFQTVKGWLA